VVKETEGDVEVGVKHTNVTVPIYIDESTPNQSKHLKLITSEALKG